MLGYVVSTANNWVALFIAYTYAGRGRYGAAAKTSIAYLQDYFSDTSPVKCGLNSLGNLRDMVLGLVLLCAGVLDNGHLWYVHEGVHTTISYDPPPRISRHVGLQFISVCSGYEGSQRSLDRVYCVIR